MGRKKGFWADFWDDTQEKRMTYELDRGYICGSCDYEWITQKSVGEPFKCPKCNSRDIINQGDKLNQDFKNVGKQMGCFIATAAYGTPFAEEINILRFWRDNFLLNNSFGKSFVNVYYKMSPPIANFIRKKEKLRVFVRFGLNPFVKLLKKHYVGKK